MSLHLTDPRLPPAPVKVAFKTGEDELGWAEHALCLGKTQLFFEPPGERQGRRNCREAIARAYCTACPVSTECRTYGRVNHENGIWGGENDEQRALAGFAPRTIFRRTVAEARRKGLRSPAANGPREISS